jgi:hypothetical protein
MKDVAFSDSDLEYLRSISIYIATPAYGEQVSVYYARSLARVFAIASAHLIPVTYSAIGNESLITRARNEMAGAFLESESTHMLFIDADISFDPMDVFTLALHRKDLVAAAYPTKGLAFNRGLNIGDEAELKKSLINYVINFTPEQTKKSKKNKGVIDVKLYDGLLEVYDAGTGFMMISRDVFKKMIKAYGDDFEYEADSTTVDDTGSLDRTTAVRHAFFDTSIDIDTNRYLSEDYTFCRRWQNIAGQVWVDPTIVLNHHGTFTYRGYPLTGNNK